MSSGVGRRLDLDLVLLWLRHRPAISTSSLGTSTCRKCGPNNQKKKEKKKADFWGQGPRRKKGMWAPHFPSGIFQYIIDDWEAEKLNRIFGAKKTKLEFRREALWNTLGFVRTPESIYSRIKDNGNKPTLTNTEMELPISSNPAG